MHGLFSYVFLQTIIYCVAVPPDYCLTPLNDSNCDMNPVPVFSYYKPGSRCELYLWRGCPTLNKFVDEYECSHICIGRLWHSMQDTEYEANFDNQIEFETPEYCSKELNSSKCTIKMDMVYTYDPIKGLCDWKVWYHCTTYNKFTDEATCYSACTGKKYEQTINKEKLTAWNNKLIDFNMDNLEDISNIIDDIGNKDDVIESDDDINVNPNKQLSNNYNMETTTTTTTTPTTTTTTTMNDSLQSSDNNSDGKSNVMTTITNAKDQTSITDPNTDKKVKDYEYDFDKDKYQNGMLTHDKGTIPDIKILV